MGPVTLVITVKPLADVADIDHDIAAALRAVQVTVLRAVKARGNVFAVPAEDPAQVPH